MLSRGLIVLACFQLITHHHVEGNQQQVTDEGNRFRNMMLSTIGDNPTDLVIVLDSSGSIGAANYDKSVRFVKTASLIFPISPDKTRVAIVSYSSCHKIYTFIDYITNSADKNKCTLDRDIDSTVRYDSGGTCTNNALQRAGDVLSRRRSGVNRIIMLLTDGESNDGGSPLNTAQGLRSSGITIFSIGLGGGINRAELEGIATSVNQHVFYLDELGDVSNFGDVIKLDLKDDDYTQLGNSACTSSCGPNSVCACATKSGVIECVCNAGYFRTTGCTACPNGTYKSFKGNSDCTSCPAHSSTTSTGSLNSTDCECDPGYEEISGGSGGTCQAVQCPPRVNQDGVVMIPSNCSNTYSNTPCEFQCQNGYRIAGGSKTSRCTGTGDWSNDFLQCEKITCPALTPPLNANVTCSPPNDNSLGTTCSITCHHGYEMMGSGVNQGTVECEPQGATNGTWSRHDWECRKKTCQPLEVVFPMFVEPALCQNISEFEQECTYRCRNGYSLNGSDAINRCTASGNWSSPSPRLQCLDTEPPDITCPNDIFGTTDKNKPTRLVNWARPAASDNSGAPPKLNANHKPPHDFPIGVTVVTYTATDMARENSQCNFTVHITDEERPRIRHCPIDITVNTSSTHANVTWDEPEFIDNAGNDTIVIEKYNATSGIPFPLGDTNIIYTATDPSGNNNTCEFTITVTQHSCEHYPPPLDGALACYEAEGSTFCSVLCNKYFTFAGYPESVYICNAEKEWVTGLDMRQANMPWPDCTLIPPDARRKISKGIRFYAGPCDTGSRPIRRKFLDQFELFVSESSTGLSCDTNAGCNIKNVQVTCSEAGNRRRRQVGGEGILTVTFTATVVAPPGPDTSNTSDIPSGGVALDAYIDSIKDVIIDGDLSIDGVNITLDETSFDVEDDYVVSCEPGEILVGDLCLQCPPGTGQNETSNRCERCPVGTYQDEYGQVHCKNCPDGTSTLSPGSRSPARCRALCEAGSYSASGVKSCIACGEGFYQPSVGGTSCLPCPEGFTTWTIGSSSLDECTNPCPKGSVSYTGFKPCTPCPRGTYQPGVQQSECIPCPEGMYTHDHGAHAIEYCQVINECELVQPCGPGSTCVDLPQGYRCDCAPGYADEHCEVDIDDCSNNDACLNGGRCVDLVSGYQCECPTGYEGANCQINIDDCTDADCRFGATCIDGLNSYTCQCQEGFGGEHCEMNLYDCASDPCQNGASCIDLQSDFSCCCLPGYTGRFCEEIRDYCASAPCYGRAICNTTTTSYDCICPSGFTGRNCDIDIDECDDVNCENGGTCKDLINGFQCLCPLGFSGKRCDQVLSSDFDLHFPSARTTDRAELEGVLPDLYEFTLSFWMTTSDQQNYGTPVSYAVRGQNNEEDMDNALTLQDYNNLVLFVNGEAAFTYVQANRNSNWRFITVTWTSVTGEWAIYVDGRQENSGTDLSRGNLIRGRGMFVVGQEQDSYAGSYVSKESFIGTITQVNVWDYAMNLAEILDIYASCTHSGNAVSWSQLSTGITNQVIKRSPSVQCDAIDICDASLCINGVCVENQSGHFCVCSQGWYGPMCENEAVPCPDGVQCMNGGSCTAGQNGVCACPIGVRGRYCEDVDACDSLQCQNGGRCSVSMGKAVCACSSGFTGRNCQYDVNECSLDNGGCDHICLNFFGSFSCSCQGGYALQEDGKTCNDVSFCEYKGTFYTRGNTWEDGCDDCICQNGRAQCSPRPCPVLDCKAEETEIRLPGACCTMCLPETKTCLLDTAGNHTTFDEHRFAALGKCRYVLTQDCAGTANFEVHVQHERSSGKTRRVTLYVYVDCVEITVSPDGILKVFNETPALPYLHDSPQNVRIERIGENDVLVTTNKGLFVEWTSTAIRVHLSTQYRSTACGLCGNMNGEKADDELTRHLIQAENERTLLHGWRVDGNKYCQEREAKNESKIRFGRIRAESCSGYEHLTEARKKCRIFRRKRFAACHKYVDPTPYYSGCLEDACTCGATESCYCEEISAYVNECERNGVTIKSWKKQTSCYTICHQSEVYDDCGPPCRPTCEDPEGRDCPPSEAVCTAGCQCRAGRVLHDGQCITISDCPPLADPITPRSPAGQ